MILVQNLLRPLSGNSFLPETVKIGLLVLLVSLSSCDALKKAQRPDDDEPPPKDETELGEIQGQKKYNPKTGKYEYVTDVTVVPDTVKWTVVKDDEYPPITSSTTTSTPGDLPDVPIATPEGEKLSEYNLAILLPFLTNKFNTLSSSIDSRSHMALQFYSGAKLGLEDLSQKGIRLNVHVMDTYASESRTEELLRQGTLQRAHMIIGPVKKTNLIKVADFAKKNGKALVSPLSPSSSVTRNNSNYIQLSPSLKVHCEAITKHAKERYNTDQIVLVCRNKKAEVARLRYFQNANFAIEGSSLAERFKEYVIQDQSADFASLDVLPFLKDGETTVFILPSWSNESFIYSFMRHVDLVRGDNEVVIYGMPQWQEYERISFDYYERLNVHVSSASYIDRNSPEAIAFRQRFFSRYAMPPEEEAYIGFATTHYFGEMISQHGTRFQDVIDQYPEEAMHASFHIERVAPDGAQPEGKEVLIDRLENKFVHILKFRDYHFQPAD